jgi:hypothetical protein
LLWLRCLTDLSDGLSISELARRMKKEHDYFSVGVIIYGVCFFLSYKALFQLSYVDTFSALWYWGYGLIIVHIVGFIWCAVACLFSLMPRQLGSFISAALLVLALEFVSPDPMELHLWLHKSDYLARVSATPPKPDGGLSIVLYSRGTYLPSRPGGYLCSVEIVYDNRNDLRLVSQSQDGRASVRKVDDNFYFRYPPCG